VSKYIIHKAVEIDAVKKKLQRSLAEYEASYLMQPKYDGCNVVVKVFRNGEFEVRSRTNEVVVSMDHIAQILDSDQYSEISNSASGLVYLGEAWYEGRDVQPEISGDFRRQSPSPKLGMMVFDVLTVEEFDAGYSEVPYRERIKRMTLPIEGPYILESKVRKVLTIPQGSVTVAKVLAELSAKGGYDGVILRDPNGTWTAGSGTTGEIIKVKPTVSYDLQVVAVEEGLGKLAGHAGKLVFRWNNGRVVKAIGGTFAERKAWFENPALVIGTFWELEAMGLTPDGMLREPRIKLQRFDKTEADA